MSRPSRAPYPLPAVRAVALHCQGLAAPDNPVPTPEAIQQLVDRLGCVQIDTLQKVQRSQYIVLWSRLGTYDPADFDRLIYGDGGAATDRQFFEYWLHAACIIPLREFRYRLPRMRRYRSESGHWTWRWASEANNAELMAGVKARIEREGPLRAADFEYDGPQRQSWWDWKPAKHALEALYNRGELMIAGRERFQRIYDLRERVLPEWVDVAEPTLEEVQRYYVERAVKAFGVCQPAQAADLEYMKRSEARPHADTLIREGTLVEIAVELTDGRTGSFVIHRDNLPLLERAADGDLTAGRTTFLSPFDSLFWPKGRDRQFWGFEQALEAYKRPADRIWGYFCLPILYRDRLVGRFDPTLERKSRTLRLHALYLESGLMPDEALIVAVAATMRDFMRFHQASDLVIERSEPAEFGLQLQRAL